MILMSRVLKSALGKRQPALSIDEALYLAKEAGIATKAELQRLIVASPSFSADKSPFLISNFFNEKRKYESFNTVTDDITRESDRGESIIASQQVGETSKIDRIIAEKTGHGSNDTFWRNGAYWNARAEGHGTCMRSTTRVILKRGSGVIKVNGEEDLYKRWPIFYNRMDVVEPLYLAGCCGMYDLFIETRGGGVTGQSRSTRLAVARALVNANPSIKFNVEAALYEDIRQKMPKMPGRTGARSLRKWRKR